MFNSESFKQWLSELISQGEDELILTYNKAEHVYVEQHFIPALVIKSSFYLFLILKGFYSDILIHFKEHVQKVTTTDYIDFCHPLRNLFSKRCIFFYFSEHTKPFILRSRASYFLTRAG